DIKILQTQGINVELNLDRYKVDVNSIVDSVVDKFIVHQTDKIEKCVIREENKKGKDIKILQTQGINVEVSFTNFWRK
uniref:Isoleucine--tRNA ligase n=1 Tax=Panagrolaimus sp. ES5 TaxID=591445 RepID=A0AC34G986_9BILA